jgi:hypothetical protein
MTNFILRKKKTKGSVVVNVVEPGPFNTMFLLREKGCYFPDL